jgi:hypothetical protein
MFLFQRIASKIKAISAYTGIDTFIYSHFWKIVEKSQNINIIYSQSPDLFRHFPLNFRQQTINLSFHEQNLKWTNATNQVIHIKKRIFIEPSRGQLIFGLNKFIPFGRMHAHVYPGILGYLLCRLGIKKKKYLKTAVHFDGYIGRNYYHYFINILSALWLLEECGIEIKSTPFLIGHKIYNARHFQWLLQNNELIKQMKWMILKDDYYEVDELIKPVMHVPGRKYLESAASLYSPPFNNRPVLNVFLYRDAKYGRVISNMGEIIKIATRYNFIMLDTGEMEIYKQLEYYSNIKYLVAIHGAGITNIIFSNYKELRVLEILPGKDKLNTHYYWLATTIGVWYDAVLSADMNKNKEFYLDPIEFEFHLKNLVTQNNA